MGASGRWSKAFSFPSSDATQTTVASRSAAETDSRQAARRASTASQFLNHLLIRYFRDRTVAVQQTRSRPYCKNDNAHAEERNRRRIRDFIGYERMAHQELAEMLDDLMQKWSLWNNLFVPTGKLLSRERVGSKVIKKHEKPQTPCQRLLASPAVSDAAKTQLRALVTRTDPIVMRREINLLREQLLKRLATLDAATATAA